MWKKLCVGFLSQFFSDWSWILRVTKYLYHDCDLSSQLKIIDTQILFETHGFTGNFCEYLIIYLRYVNECLKFWDYLVYLANVFVMILIAHEGI